MKRPYQRTADGRYRTQLRHPVTGQRLSITADTLGELETHRRRVSSLRGELRYGLVTPDEAAASLRGRKGRDLTLAQLWARYVPTVADRSRPAVRSAWERRVWPYFQNCAVRDLTESRLRAWALDLERAGFASKTREAAYYALAGAVRTAISDGELDAYPWGGWRPARGQVESPREVVTSLDEFARLVAAASESGGDLATRVAVLGLTGLRQGEACALGWDDVDLDLATLTVRYQAGRGWWTRSPDRPRDPTKTKKQRTQRIHPTIIELLAAQREALASAGAYREDGPVFPADASGSWRRVARLVRPEELRRLVTLANLPNPHRWVTHSLRHSFATLEILANGGDLRAAQARTGHATLQQLEGYVHAGGRGLMPSAVPALPAELTARLLPASPSARLLAPPPGPVEPERAWADLAAEWVANGSAGKSRPAQVTEAARRAYRRAWRAEGKGAAARARRAVVAAWGRALARARKTAPKAQ